ncbi:MAG: dihydroneopterin aldolase [Chloroflexota bacterium]
MDKILIKDLLARGILGMYDQERQQPQDILINLTIFADLTQAAKNDNLDHSLNYHTLSQEILEHVERSARYTVEALAEDISRLCLHYPQVKKVIVRVEKPGAVPEARSVGVEIERSQGKNFSPPDSTS